MENKRILIFLGIIFVSLALVGAAWYFIIGGNVKVNIASIGSYKEATLTFTDLFLNTTNGSDKSSSIMTFAYNRDGIFKVEIIETIADLSAGECLNGDKDCNTEYWLNDGIDTQQIFNNKNVTLTSNSYPKKLWVNMSCMAYSSPQTRDISIKLNQVG